MKWKIFFLNFVLFNSLFFSQEFTKTSLIDIPGDNKNYEIFPNEAFYFGEEKFICWENHIDSVYNIYLKRISPTVSDSIFTIYTSLNESCNPTMALNGNNTLFIVWQTKLENKWQLFGRTYRSRNLSDVKQITNSGKNNISPALSNSRLVWISEGDLLIKKTSDLDSEPYVLDKKNCSNPVIIKEDENNYTNILYEKGSSFNKQIYQAIKKKIYPENKLTWEINKISKFTYNINPRFGMEYVLSFQTLTYGFWKTCYSYFEDSLTISNNTNYNRENPFIFTYPIATAQSENNETPFYLAFDSDLLNNNREIYLEPILPSLDTILNISSMEGDDTYPTLSIINKEGEPYLAVIWQHNDSGQTSIWWSLTKYDPVIGDVEKNKKSEQFNLSQNYPNPFNPTTTIKYQIPEHSAQTNVASDFSPSNVELKIYDILGREITTLVNEKQNSGNYKVIFDASNLSSGVYYYQLKIGRFTETKKMLLLR